MSLSYTIDIIINKPRQKVVELMEDPANMPHWQPGFQSMKHIDGEKGKNGMRSEMHYKMGKRDVKLIETITNYGFPETFNATYEAAGVYNEQKNSFIEIDANTTKWVSENYFEFTNLMMRIMGFLMPGSFKKQSCEYLENFKRFVESTD